jgi:hypothetical protein
MCICVSKKLVSAVGTTLRSPFVPVCSLIATWLPSLLIQSVCANGQHISSGPGVSLLAASLPGVQLLPFHVSEPALPSITAEQWQQLLQKPGSSSSSSSNKAMHQNAAIVLSSPHFVDVEKFLLRLSSALPGMPVGGQAC